MILLRITTLIYILTCNNLFIYAVSHGRRNKAKTNLVISPKNLIEYQSLDQLDQAINQNPKIFDALISMFSPYQEFDFFRLAKLYHPIIEFDNHFDRPHAQKNLELFINWASHHTVQFCQLLNKKIIREKNYQSLLSLIAIPTYAQQSKIGQKLFQIYYSTTLNPNFSGPTPFHQGQEARNFYLEIIKMYQNSLSRFDHKIRSIFHNLQTISPYLLMNLFDALVENKLIFTKDDLHLNSAFINYFLRSLYDLSTSTVFNPSSNEWNQAPENLFLREWLENTQYAQYLCQLLTQKWNGESCHLGLCQNNAELIKERIFEDKIFNYYSQLYPQLAHQIIKKNVNSFWNIERSVWGMREWIVNNPKLFLQSYQELLECRNYWHALDADITEEIFNRQPALMKNLLSQNQKKDNKFEIRAPSGRSNWLGNNKKRLKNKKKPIKRARLI